MSVILENVNKNNQQKESQNYVYSYHSRSSHILSTADATHLITTASSWPFDSTIIISNTVSNKIDFKNQINASVQNTNSISIGVSTNLHFTTVAFGKTTGIPNHDWNIISASGDMYFKKGQFAQGIAAIGYRAKSSQQHTVIVARQQEQSSYYVGWGVAAVVILAAAILGYIWYRRRRVEQEHRAAMAELNNEIADKQIRNQEEKAWFNKFQNTVPRSPSVSTNVSSSVYYNSPPQQVQPAVVSYVQPVYYSPPAVVVVEEDYSRPVIYSHHNHNNVTVVEDSSYNPSAGTSSSSWGSSSDSGGSSSSDSSWGSSSSDSSSYDSSSSSSWDSGGSSSGGSSDW